jgi:hypothetical protein
MSDTSHAVEAIRFDMLRRLSPAEKARRVTELTQAASLWALAGLRERFPDAVEPELLLRLAALRLGDDVVARAYGWPASRGGDGA